MDWLQDTIGRWIRILSAAGGGSTPLDEAVHQISRIGEAPAKKAGFGRPKRNAAAPPAASTVTVLCRQLVAGVIAGDLMIDQLCTLTGQTRAQVLDQLSSGLPRQLRGEQLRALQDELSGGCALLQAPQAAPHSALATRVGQVLKLAEEEASVHIEKARAEAAEIVRAARAEADTASAGTRQPCPRCGAR